MKTILYHIASLFMLGFFWNIAFADDAVLEKAVLNGDWQTVYNVVTDSSAENDEILDFLKDISCLALDMDCAPAFYETSPHKGITGETIKKWITLLRRDHKRNAFLSYLMANSYSRSGFHKKALKEHKKAIKQNDKNAIFYLSRSRTYAIMNDMKRSLKDANKAIRLDPDISMAYTLRGAIFDSQRKFQEALKNYAEAIRLKPERAANYYNSANTFRHMNQNSDAISEYTKALTLDSTLVGAYFNRANAYFDIAAYEKALRDYRKFVAVGSDEFRQMLPRAQSQIRTIDRILNDVPEDKADMLVDQGVRNFQQNNYAGVVESTNKALALDSTKSDAYYWRAFGYWRLGNKEQAIDDFTRAIHYHPDDTTAFFNRGALFVETDRLKEAINDFSSAIELNTAYVLAYENRARTFEILGLNDSAITDYEALLKIIPESDNKQREYLNDLIVFLANPNLNIDTTEIENCVKEAYKYWGKQDWVKFAKVISYDDIESFQSALLPFAMRLFNQNEHVILHGKIYRRSYFVDDEPHISFALYMKIFSNKKSGFKPMVTIKFIEVVEIIPRGLKHANARIRIKIEGEDGKEKIVVENDVVRTSSGWKINMPTSLLKMAEMLGNTPGQR